MSDSSTNPSLTPPSPGQMLAGARNGRSLSIDELSHRTKISASILRALEEDRYDALPRVRVYVLGFVRSFANAVGLDPDETAAHYLDAWHRWQASAAD